MIQRFSVMSLLAILVVFSSTLAEAATSEAELHQDATVEARARTLTVQLRCVVCQNQSIDDSDAPLARDLRRLVRERIVAGDTNEQVMAFMVARYGDFILLKPPVRRETLFLWGGPVLFVLLAIGAVFFWYRREKARPELSVETEVLSDEEQKMVTTLLSEGKSK